MSEAGGRVSGQVAVREYMTAAPFTVPPSMPLEVAAQFMKARRIRHLPVVEDRHLVGMLSEAQLHAGPGSGKTVHEVMQPEPFVVAAEATLREVVHQMVTGRHEATIVISNGRPQGIFTTIDALKLLDAMLG